MQSQGLTQAFIAQFVNRCTTYIIICFKVCPALKIMSMLSDSRLSGTENLPKIFLKNVLK